MNTTGDNNHGTEDAAAKIANSLSAQHLVTAAILVLPLLEDCKGRNVFCVHCDNGVSKGFVCVVVQAYLAAFARVRVVDTVQNPENHFESRVVIVRACVPCVLANTKLSIGELTKATIQCKNYDDEYLGTCIHRAINGPKRTAADFGTVFVPIGGDIGPLVGAANPSSDGPFQMINKHAIRDVNTIESHCQNAACTRGDDGNRAPLSADGKINHAVATVKTHVRVLARQADSATETHPQAASGEALGGAKNKANGVSLDNEGAKVQDETKTGGVTGGRGGTAHAVMTALFSSLHFCSKPCLDAAVKDAKDKNAYHEHGALDVFPVLRDMYNTIYGDIPRIVASLQCTCGARRIPQDGTVVCNNKDGHRGTVQQPAILYKHVVDDESIRALLCN